MDDYDILVKVSAGTRRGQRVAYVSANGTTSAIAVDADAMESVVQEAKEIYNVDRLNEGQELAHVTTNGEGQLSVEWVR